MFLSPLVISDEQIGTMMSAVSAAIREIEAKFL
jgi:hypothetical protein